MEADESRGTSAARRTRKLPPWSSLNPDLTRLLALSDGIFAFAMTLLVLGLIVPAGLGSKSDIAAYLGSLWPAFLAYLLGFFVIFLYWRQHGLLFRYIVSYDWTVANLNVLFLLFVAIMPFMTILLAAAGQALLVVWLYAALQVAAGGTLLALWTYASHARRHLDPTIPEPWVAFVARAQMVGPILFAASMPLALWNPYACEAVWFAGLPVIAMYRYRARHEPAAEVVS